MHLGQHWLAEAAGCDPATLTPKRLREALIAVPEALGLTRVSEPQVYAQGTTDVAGIVLIAESHLSLHALTQSSVLFVDFFSCGPFPIAAAKRLLTDSFDCQTWHEQVITRRVEPLPTPLADSGARD